jgi:hypothetical protein
VANGADVPGVAAAVAVAAAAAQAAQGSGATASTVATAADTEAAKYPTDPKKTAAAAVKAAADTEAVKANASPATVAAAAGAAVTALVDAAVAKAVAAANALSLAAISPGAWGNSLKARVDHDVSADVAASLGVTAADLFNLYVRDDATGVTERYLNITVIKSARQVDKVVGDASNLVGVVTPVPASIPDAHPAPPVGGNIWLDNVPPTYSGVAPATVATDGVVLTPSDYIGSGTDKTGLEALRGFDLFNLVCIPPDTRAGSTDPSVYQAAMQLCVDRRAMLIVDSPADWEANPQTAASQAQSGLSALNLTGPGARNAALYFPRVVQPDPKQGGILDVFVPCGIIAGVMARTDSSRGVWKAPAGLDASLNNIQDLAVNLTDPENGLLNPLGINCLRSFPVNGRVVWGARTLRGADQLGDDYKYVPVRRLALFLEESLYRGTQWVVFEPNDEPLWSQIRLNVGAFMHNLFRQGAFQGSSPKQAYFVKVDSETTTQNDIDNGIVNIVVGFAPLKPAEFVIIQLQQMAGQIQT